ncbi:excisionase family DNA-binding protein [Metabacillus malikii]|uniref:Excisionase family DNA binding protein n=1 Tax=Metabacillus malikii TaxID=1504265 RepID=A0ABT9ZEK0_9BACI|nr:excisionase family DNA-binding protein [Metabacillus malikii]MDQ0230359.1 excisionase family DNA binding protein [Metabacillus malikii]
MYLTIQEAADYLSLNEETVKSLILQKKIKALFDGDSYLINKDQFTTHFEQLEKYKQLYEEYMKEPIPEDPDVKDED